MEGGLGEITNNKAQITNISNVDTPQGTDGPVVETDLTEEERMVIQRCRENYIEGGYIPISDVCKNQQE